jgi:hypothetical protein
LERECHVVAALLAAAREVEQLAADVNGREVEEVARGRGAERLECAQQAHQTAL